MYAHIHMFQCAVPGCGELHADRQPRAEEAGLPVPHELRQKPARHRHHGRQHVCQGKSTRLLSRTSPLKKALVNLARITISEVYLSLS